MPATNVPWAPPLTRLNPFYPGQMGVPGTDSETGLRLDTNGTIFYVDPNAVGVSDQRDGTNPIEPLQTVGAALTHCQAYRNDVIVVAPNAYWTWADRTIGRATPISEEITISVPGVRLVGLFPSSSTGVPWVPTQNSGICITVNAMDVLIEGFLFWGGVYANGIAIRAQWGGAFFGDNLTVRNCYFHTDLDYGIQLDDSWYADIHNNYFNGVNVAHIHSMDVLGDADFASIHDNTFMVDTGAAIDLEDVDNCSIYRNLIYGDGTGTNNFIDLTGGADNIVADNWLACTLAGGQYNTTCSDAGSGAWIRNHCIDGETGAAPT